MDSANLIFNGIDADSGSYLLPPMTAAQLSVIICAQEPDAAGQERVHVVGHCMGGMVAIAAAAAMPERVASVTLVATSLKPAADQQFAAWAEQRSPDWVRSLARRAFPGDGAAAAHVDYAAYTDTGDFYWRRMVADYRALSADTLSLVEPDEILVDRYVMAPDTLTPGDWPAFYTEVLRGLRPGTITQVVVHFAYDDAEMRAASAGYDIYDAPWRQRDFDFFTSPAAREVLASEGVVLTTWRELGKLLGGPG